MRPLFHPPSLRWTALNTPLLHTVICRLISRHDTRHDVRNIHTRTLRDYVNKKNSMQKKLKKDIYYGTRE